MVAGRCVRGAVRLRDAAPLCALLLLALLAIIAMLAAPVCGGRHDTDSDADGANTITVDQSVYDSLAAEIHAMLDTEHDANADAMGDSQAAVDAGSRQANALNLDQEMDAQQDVRAEAESEQLAAMRLSEAAAAGHTADPAAVAEEALLAAHDNNSPAAFADEFAFLSGSESVSASALSNAHSAFDGIDVEAHLSLIEAEVDAALGLNAQQNAAKMQAQQQAEQQQTKRSKRSMRSRARKQHAAAAAAAAAAALPTPSARQQQLIQHVDSYRQARGHAAQDVSALESRAQTHATAQAGLGYFPAPAPTVAGAGGTALLQQGYSPFAGQVSVAPAYQNNENALLAQLGIAPLAPVAAAPAAPVAREAASVAGMGALLAALRKVQQQDETSKMLHKLTALMSVSAAAQQRAAAPAVVASPFNYGQSLVATPAGWQNPNLAEATYGPRLIPGQLPGQSPAYPTFIPKAGAEVGTEDGESPWGDVTP